MDSLATAWLDEHPSGVDKGECESQRKALEEVANPILSKAYAEQPAGDDAEEGDVGGDDVESVE
mgnify:CR=1 FL=1